MLGAGDPNDCLEFGSGGWALGISIVLKSLKDLRKNAKEMKLFLFVTYL